MKWWNCGGGGGCGYGDTTEVEYVHVEDGYADGLSPSPRLFAQQVAQGALQRSLQRAPCHHERSSEQGTP